MMQRERLTLYELNSLVRHTVETVLQQTYWVEAEVASVRQSGGHLYIELQQKEEGRNTPVARATAICWQSVWERVEPLFIRTTGSTVTAGQQLLLCVVPRFHEAYGFSWMVQDIDPRFTLGDMARKRQEIIEQLRSEGALDMQRQLPLGPFVQRVAVISSEQAAGWGDFRHQLATNDRGYAFSLTLFPAVMQGEAVEQSIIRALDAVYEQLEAFDVVVIIRGGGATTDLSGFDAPDLARNVANFPLPVITGIGHERDKSVVDLVAYQSVKTPTAAAEWLIARLAETDARIADCRLRVVQCVRARLEHEHNLMARLAERIPLIFGRLRERREAGLDRLMERLATLMRQKVAGQQHTIDSLRQRMNSEIRMQLLRNRQQTEQLETRLEALDPKRVLQRGYSITTHNGRVVMHKKQLKAGDVIETRLADGKVTSVIA